MNLQEQLTQDKLTLIAMNALIEEYAAKLGLSLEGSLTQQSAQALVNRSQVYEKKQQLQQALKQGQLPPVGRPGKDKQETTPLELEEEWRLQETVLRYRLDHPGAMVTHEKGTTGYSDGFKRLILALADSWQGRLEKFCQLVEVPYPTLAVWQKDDQRAVLSQEVPKPQPTLPEEASETCREIVFDYEQWEGKMKDFLGFESQQRGLSPATIRRVLVLAGMLPLKSSPGPRYRDSTERLTPGALLVTDGKAVEGILTASRQKKSYNWQAMVDQATACHTGAAITKTECSQGVQEAFEKSCQLIGHPPLALLHDNKSLYDHKALKIVIEATTVMIPATPARPENKAVLEGEFGKFEQTVGAIHLDDSSMETMRQSAVSEVIRAYTAALNHAGRAEFEGRSRLQVLREACPNPEKDRKFIEQLKANHQKKHFRDPLNTRAVTLRILNAAFEELGLQSLDGQGKTRFWLSSRFSPEAVRQALAIFSTQREKGRLQQKTALRYLVKVIQNCQHELDLRREEECLLHYAQQERRAWLRELEEEYRALKEEGKQEATTPIQIAYRLSENALFGGLFLQRAFWEDKLKGWLEHHRPLFESVCAHVRRLFEANEHDRFQLISRLITWQMGLTR